MSLMTSATPKKRVDRPVLHVQAQADAVSLVSDIECISQDDTLLDGLGDLASLGRLELVTPDMPNSF